MFEVVCKSYYRRGNPKPQHKNLIEAGDMEKLNLYFSNDCPDKLQEFVWFIFDFIWVGEEGKVGADSFEFKHANQDRVHVCHYKAKFFSFYFLNALQSDINSNRVYVLGHIYAHFNPRPESG